MVTTITIDDTILQAAERRARETGSTPDAVLNRVLRQGLGLEEFDLPPLRDGCPPIRVHPSFEPTSESILGLLDRVEQTNDLGFPLDIPAATMECIERVAARWDLPIGKAAVQFVEESLIVQEKWPSHNGELEALRRPDGTPVVTLEFLKYLQDRIDLENLPD